MANKKPKPELPKVGDRVLLRGHGKEGVVVRIHPETKWTQVRWDTIAKGPRYCHLMELELAKVSLPTESP